MAKYQGIARLRGTIDGVTYLEGAYGRWCRSKTSLNKAVMDANPKYDTLRLAQRELGSYSRFGGLLRSGLRQQLRQVKPYRGMERLNKLLHQIKNEDLLHGLGERTVPTGLATERGRNLLLGFDFYGQTSVNNLPDREFELDPATGEALIPLFNPASELTTPAAATHVAFRSIMIGMDFEAGEVYSKASPVIYLSVDATAADLILQPGAPPEVSNLVVYVVQVLFYREVNGFRELGVEGAALSVVGVEVRS